MRRVWILNLDAERELAASGSYETPKRLLEQIEHESERVREALCPGEATLPKSDAVREDGVAIAWCPTPSALRRAERARLRVPSAPAIDVLRRVNHRCFALELSQSERILALLDALPSRRGASLRFERARAFVAPGASLASELSLFDGPAPFGTGHRLKRSYGFAGKGQRRLTAPLRDDDRRWVSDALRLGGFVREPEVALTAEVSQHGYVDESVLLLGAPCLLRCDRFGAPLEVVRAPAEALDAALVDALGAATRALGEALRAAGYFGPFGLDSRLFDSEVGPGVTLIGDVNARFTMGWSIGLGDAREEALGRLAAR